MKAWSIDELLSQMVEKQASDLYFTTGVYPQIKVHGTFEPVSDERLNQEDLQNLLVQMMTPDQIDYLQKYKESNFAIGKAEIGRFRVNVFQQRGQYGAVIRHIETTIPSTEELGLPKIVEELSMVKRGLVLFIGATGSGKSSSLAAMIGHRNLNSHGHIITIEDPIEFIHKNQKSIITQREVGVDTDSFDIALKNTLRQAPDVILIGEIRSRETMEYAITFAETGHLCLSTLHASNANQALDRIINFFPEERHKQLFLDLSLNLRGIVAQQLIPDINGNGRHLAAEVLLNSPLACEHIRKGEVHLLKDLIKKSTEMSMQTFDQALFELYKQEKISYEDALKHADSVNDLRLFIKLDEEGKPNNDDRPNSMEFVSVIE